MKKSIVKMVIQPGKKYDFNNRKRQSIPKKSFRDALSEAKSELDILDIPEYLKMFINVPYYNKESLFQNPFPQKIEDMASQRFLFSSNDLEREIAWNASFLSLFSNEINEIIKLKKSFNSFVLSSELDLAKKSLESIEEIFGYSYWLLENKIYLIHKMEGLEKHKEYVNSIKNENRKINGITKYILSYVSIKIEDNVPFDKYELSIKETLFLNKEQKVNENLNDYLKFKFLDNSSTDNFDFIPINIFESNTAIIDRYIMLIKTLRRLELTSENEKIIENVRKILFNIEDDEVERLLGNNSLKNEKFLYLVDMYTVGNYEKFLKESKDFLLKNPEVVDLYPLFVKSKIYLKKNYFRVHSTDSLLDSIFDNLSNLFLSNNKFDESLSELIKTTYIFHNEVWAMQLRGLIDEIISSKNQKNTTIFQKMYLDNLLKSNPLSILHGKEENKVAETIFIENNEEFGLSPTLNLYNNFYNGNIDELNKARIPEYRKKSFIAKSLFLKKDYTRAQVIYEDLATNDNELISLEGKVGLVECYIQLKEFLLAVKMITKSYVKSDVLIRQFPIKELIEEIELEGYNEVLRKEISLSILYDIYSKNFSVEKDYEKADSCEDFLLTHGFKKPSDIDFIVLEKEVDKNSIIYYLKNIAVENVIDNFPIFNNSEEVETERIAICRILSENDENNSKKYQEEIKKITHKQIIKRGLAEVEKSKIYVDAEGIKTSLYKSNKESFQRYISLLRANSDDSESGFFQLEENLDYEGQVIDLMIPTDERTQLLFRMVFDTRDSFVSSSEYGLDGYLSVGIRHGTLSGQLRAPLEQEHLITQKDSETGNYILADIWQNRYRDSQLRILVDGFDRFGKTIDNIILKLRKEWIQIRTEKNNSEGLFNFVITIEELKELESKININTNYDEFMDKVFDLLWKKTDTSLLNIRKMIKNDLKKAFDEAFNELLVFIDKQKEVMDATEIKSKIAKAQTSIQYELEKVANWFKRNDASEMSDYKVDLPINIAMEWIQNIYNVQQIKFIEKEIDEFKLRGRTLKSFSDIAFILFDNIIKHSKVAGEISTKIKITNNNGTIILNCSNIIDTSVIKESKRNELENLKEKINKEKDYKNVKIEGGSGFYKIKKIVSVDMGASSYIDFKYEEDIFNVVIKINTKGDLL